jgi:uncharacterized protein (TIGR03435 family)
MESLSSISSSAAPATGHQPRRCKPNKPFICAKLLLAAVGIAVVGGTVVLGLINAQQLRAQSAPSASSPAPSFEVASVRRGGPHEPDSIHFLPGRLVARNQIMLMIIGLAYGRDFGDFGFRPLRHDRIVGGPDWIRPGQFSYGEGYDIEAKMDDSLAAKFGNRECGPAFAHGRCAYRQTMMLMLQSLLSDRFKLQVRHETREGPVYALVVAEGGSKLSTCSLPFSSTDTAALPPRPSPCPPGKRCVEGCMPTSVLADRLSFDVPELRPVLDQTGLNGSFNVKLQFGQANIADETESDGSNPGIASPPPVGSVGPSLFKAVQLQLGLKLKPTKGPVETLVIEYIERPSEN